MPQQRLEIHMQGTSETVRNLLADLRRFAEGLGLGPDQCGTIEIALAEALNNIIEHAYAPRSAGPLWLSAARQGARLVIELRDQGQALPGIAVPEAQLPCAETTLEHLPEGGFGWFLIHQLTDSVEYHRIGAENHLTLGFAINADV